MNEVTLCHDREAALTTALRSLWERAHGAPAGPVRVLVGSDSVALWLEDVLSPAERAATQRTEVQQLLQRYAEKLLATIQPDLRAQVEAITGRRIVSGNVRADVDTGHVLCFFVLGERLTPPPESSP